MSDEPRPGKYDEAARQEPGRRSPNRERPERLMSIQSTRQTGDMNWEPQEDGRWEAIHGKACMITLEPRPSYCDRGNWIAKLFPEGELARDIDAADGWPRYYFDQGRAKAEIEAWLVKRGQAL
jgi:hypothetical protein